MRNKFFNIINIMLCLSLVFTIAGCDSQSQEDTVITAIPNVQLTPTDKIAETTVAPTAEPKVKIDDINYSNIFVLRDTMGEYADFVQLLDRMDEMGMPFYLGSGDNDFGLIGKDDVVLIKVNAQWDQRGGTNTDLLNAVLQSIVNHPEGFEGEIIVADNGQAQYGTFRKGGSLDWEKNNAIDTSQSVQDVVDSHAGDYNVSTYLWDTITKIKVAEYSDGDMNDGFVVYPDKDPETEIIVSYAKFTTAYGTKISFKEGIWDEDTNTYSKENFKVINMPVLKSHSGYGVTACIKHYMGVPSDKLTSGNPHRSIGQGGMGTLMAETTIPTLNILDAIWINPTRGPRTEYHKAVNTQIIAVSTDPFALDYWGVNEILIPEATRLGNNISAMSTESTSPRGFGYWMQLSLDAITNKGYTMRFGSDDVRVFEVADE